MLTAGAETKDESAIYVRLDTINKDIWKSVKRAKQRSGKHRLLNSVCICSCREKV